MAAWSVGNFLTDRGRIGNSNALFLPNAAPGKAANHPLRRFLGSASGDGSWVQLARVEGRSQPPKCVFRGSCPRGFTGRSSAEPRPCEARTQPIPAAAAFGPPETYWLDKLRPLATAIFD